MKSEANIALAHSESICSSSMGRHLYLSGLAVSALIYQPGSCDFRVKVAFDLPTLPFEIARMSPIAWKKS